MKGIRYTAEFKAEAIKQITERGHTATDMYQSGIALEYIQALAGHESARRTEIYIKARLNKPVTSNTRKIGS